MMTRLWSRPMLLHCTRRSAGNQASFNAARHVPCEEPCRVPYGCRLVPVVSAHHLDLSRKSCEHFPVCDVRHCRMLRNVWRRAGPRQRRAQRVGRARNHFQGAQGDIAPV